MENTYITKMTQRKCLCTRSTIALLSAALFCAGSFVFHAGVSPKKKKNGGGGKAFNFSQTADLKCLHKRLLLLSRSIRAAYCLVNLPVLSGRRRFPLDDSSWPGLRGAGRGAALPSTPGAALCSVPVSRTSSVRRPPVLRVPATHLAALHLSSLPFCKHARLTF